MLTPEQNQLLTCVGPGTPGGNYLRKFWLPVGLSSELLDFPRRVRFLGEDYALFKDKKGRIGLTGLYCPHRLASLEYGYVEEEGIRCRQHGWMFDVCGNCVEQPAEDNPNFRNNVKLKSYPVRELSGLIFAYLGSGEPPSFPRFDVLVKEGVRRIYKRPTYSGNYLQILENGAGTDPWHTVYTHQLQPLWFRKNLVTFEWEKITSNNFAGIKTRSVRPGPAEGSMYERVNVFVAPTSYKIALRKSYTAKQNYNIPHVQKMVWWMPVDDTITTGFTVDFIPKTGYSEQEANSVLDSVFDSRPFDWPPRRDKVGRPLLETVPQEDASVTLSPGEITPRQYEHLGKSDQGVIMLRRMLLDGIDAVKRGEDPLGLSRGKETTEVIEIDTKDELLTMAKA
jgi:5,5'-dehydrodivanillate O-demethylase